MLFLSPLVPELTRREERLLLLRGQGHGLREIAAILGISELRARKIRDEAVEKVGLGSEHAAVALVARADERASLEADA